MRTSVWRLIPLLQAPGSVQMAIDQWLLEQHQQDKYPPVLRFYTWSPAAISLGYHQRRWPGSWQQLTWQGTQVDVVRRPSGGRAVLHQGDLTYMVVMSGLSGDRLVAYQAICEFLIQGWRSLGLELHYGAAGRGYIHNASCFATATGADLISADGTKFIGSAQLRRGTAILQHGSMQLQPDSQLFTQVFGVEAPAPVKLPLTLGRETPIQTVIDALVAAAGECFDTQWVSKPLSDAEWQTILAALGEKEGATHLSFNP